MKVSTDACIFGAAAAEFFAEKELQTAGSITNYLDIGTGTGLLSLMLAQKTSAHIDAVEIDAAACEQAGTNFAASPFKKRLAAYNCDILHFSPGKKYDAIICNPPFFEGDLQSPDKKKNAAKHDIALTIQQLLTVADDHLKEDGSLAVLLPCHRIAQFEKDAAAVPFFLYQKILLRHTLIHPGLRAILFLSRVKKTQVTKKLIIKNEAGNYTDAFMFLLKDYYLHL